MAVHFLWTIQRGTQPHIRPRRKRGRASSRILQGETRKQPLRICTMHVSNSFTVTGTDNYSLTTKPEDQLYEKVSTAWNSVLNNIDQAVNFARSQSKKLAPAAVGSAFGSTTGTQVFGISAKPFGASAFPGNASAFGSPSNSSGGSAFGTSKPFGGATQSAFGQNSTPAAFSAFSQPSSTAPAASGGFGAFGSSSAAPSAFGQSSFGQPSAFGSSGSSQPAKTAFGSTGFGSFGKQRQSTAVFRTAAHFSFPGTSDSSPASPFGKAATSAPTTAFGHPSQPFSAIGTAPALPSAFGQTSAPASAAFGKPSVPAATSAFGQPSVPTSAFGSTSAPVSAFGQPSAFGAPGTPAKSTTGFSSFAPPASGSAAFEAPPATSGRSPLCFPSYSMMADDG